MQFKCLFCPRTFSTRTAYGQYKKFYNPTDKELKSILNVNNISLDDEEFSHNIEEVRNL